MGDLNQNWSSPWRSLQQLLANESRAAQGSEPRERNPSGDSGVSDDSSWLKRARGQRIQTRARA